MIEPRLPERRQARLGETHPRGDEVGVEAEPVRRGDDRLQVVAHQRLAARQPELHRAERPRLLEHAQPLRSLELAADAAEVGRVVAEHAVQRAAVGELEQQPERRPGTSPPRCPARSRAQLQPGPLQRQGDECADVGREPGRRHTCARGPPRCRRPSARRRSASGSRPRSVELHHAFGIEQHVRLLRRLPLQPKARADRRTRRRVDGPIAAAPALIARRTAAPSHRSSARARRA